MNKKNAREFLPLVRALAEGKVIQMFDGSSWEDLDSVTFSYERSNYRIKPEPRERWFVQYKGGSESGPYGDRDAAECYALHDHDYTIVCYREVIE